MFEESGYGRTTFICIPVMIIASSEKEGFVMKYNKICIIDRLLEFNYVSLHIILSFVVQTDV
jgi:hypothetical protein